MPLSSAESRSPPASVRARVKALVRVGRIGALSASLACFPFAEKNPRCTSESSSDRALTEHLNRIEQLDGEKKTRHPLLPGLLRQ